MFKLGRKLALALVVLMMPQAAMAQAIYFPPSISAGNNSYLYQYPAAKSQNAPEGYLTFRYNGFGWWSGGGYQTLLTNYTRTFWLAAVYAYNQNSVDYVKFLLLLSDASGSYYYTGFCCYPYDAITHTVEIGYAMIDQVQQVVFLFDGTDYSTPNFVERGGGNYIQVYLQDREWYIGEEPPWMADYLGGDITVSAVKGVALRYLFFSPYETQYGYYPGNVFGMRGGVQVGPPFFANNDAAFTGPFLYGYADEVIIEDIDIQ
jgi:hypothetical protein